MLDRTVTIEDGVTGTVYDVAMEQVRSRDWVVSRIAVQEPGKGLRRRGQTHVVEWRDVVGLVGREPTQGATHLIAALNEMRPADAASVLHDLPPERRTAVVAAMDDERLADVLEELPDEDQVEILDTSTASAPPTSWRSVGRRCGRPDRRPRARDRGSAAQRCSSRRAETSPTDV